VIAAAVAFAAAVAVFAALAFAAMNMAMLDLFARSFADIENLHVEMKGLARKRMVGIELDLIAFETDNGDKLGALFALRLKLHADLDIGTAEFGLGHHEYEAVIALAIGIGRSDDAAQLIAGVLALKLFFETRDKIAVPVEVHEGLGAFRGVKKIPAIIFKAVIDGDHSVLLYCHRFPFIEKI